MISEAQQIVDIFEENITIPTEVEDYEKNAEEILLYLAAKNFLEKLW